MKIEIEKRTVRLRGVGPDGLPRDQEGPGYVFQWNGHELAIVEIVTNEGENYGALAHVGTGNSLFPRRRNQTGMALLFSFLTAGSESDVYYLDLVDRIKNGRVKSVAVAMGQKRRNANN